MINSARQQYGGHALNLLRCRGRHCQGLFSAKVESVLLYGCEAWAIISKITKELDSCYPGLLHLHVKMCSQHSLKQHIINAELYGDMPKITQKIRERRTRFAGHCARSYLNWFTGHLSMG